MSKKIVEGELFVNLLTRKVYRVKKIYMNSLVMDEMGNERVRENLL